MRLSLLIKIALLAALSALLMQLSFPVFPAYSYLRYDASEVPALIAAFALGPAAGIAVVLLKNLVFAVAHFQPTELVGLPLNALAGSTLVGVAGSCYQLRKSKPVAMGSLMLGVLAMTLVMVPANLVLLPIFQRLFCPGTPYTSDQIVHLLSAVLVPFNLFKGTLTSVLTFLAYKRVSPILKGIPGWDVGLTSIREK